MSSRKPDFTREQHPTSNPTYSQGIRILCFHISQPPSRLRAFQEKEGSWRQSGIPCTALRKCLLSAQVDGDLNKPIPEPDTGLPPPSSPSLPFMRTRSMQERPFISWSRGLHPPCWAPLRSLTALCPSICPNNEDSNLCPFPGRMSALTSHSSEEHSACSHVN